MGGHWSPATIIFNGYSEHVRRRYGEAATTAAGVRARAGEGPERLPLDPVFLPFFAAWQRGRSDGGDAAAAMLEEVVAATAALATDAHWATRARELGERARRLLPPRTASGPKISFDFSYTLRPPRS